MIRLSSWVFVLCAVVHEHRTMQKNAEAHFTSLILMFRRQQLLLPYEGCANYTAMLNEHLCRSRSGLPRPIPLNLCTEHHPGNWNSARLNHPMNCHLVGLKANSARSIGDDENFVAFAESLNRGHREAYLSP